MKAPKMFIQALEMAIMAEENNAKALREKGDSKRKWEGSSKTFKKAKVSFAAVRSKGPEVVVC